MALIKDIINREFIRRLKGLVNQRLKSRLTANLFIGFIAMVVIVLLPGDAHANNLIYNVELGKSYSGRYLQYQGDVLTNVSRSFLSVSCLYPRSDEYSIGLELGVAVDDRFIGASSDPRFGDALSFINILQEFYPKFGGISPTLQLSTGVYTYSYYYTQLAPGTKVNQQFVAAYSWADFGVALKHKIFAYDRFDFDFKIKFDTLFSYMFTLRGAIPIMFSFGVRY